MNENKTVPRAVAPPDGLYEKAFLAALTGIAWKQQIASVAAYNSAVTNAAALAEVAAAHLRSRTGPVQPDFGGKP